jgi:hypothetical protein
MKFKNLFLVISLICSISGIKILRCKGGRGVQDPIEAHIPLNEKILIEADKIFDEDQDMFEDLKESNEDIELILEKAHQKEMEELKEQNQDKLDNLKSKHTDEEESIIEKIENEELSNNEVSVLSSELSVLELGHHIEEESLIMMIHEEEIDLQMKQYTEESKLEQAHWEDEENFLLNKGNSEKGLLEVVQMDNVIDAIQEYNLEKRKLLTGNHYDEVKLEEQNFEDTIGLIQDEAENYKKIIHNHYNEAYQLEKEINKAYKNGTCYDEIEELKEQLDMLRDSHQDQQTQILKYHEERLNNLQERQQEEEDELSDKYDESFEEFEEDWENKVEEVIDTAIAFEDLQQAVNNDEICNVAIEAAVEKKEDAVMTTQVVEEVQDMSHDNIKEDNDLKLVHRQEEENVKVQHQQDMEDLVIKNNKDENELLTQQSTQEQQIQDQIDNALSDACLTKLIDKLASIKEENFEEYHNLVEQNRKDLIQKVVEQHDQEINLITKNYEAEIQQTEQNISKELEALDKADPQMADLKEEYMDSKKELLDEQHSEEIELIHYNYSEEEDLHKAHIQKLKTIVTKYKSLEDTVTDRIDEAIQIGNADKAAELQEELDDMVHKHRIKEGELRKQQEVEELNLMSENNNEEKELTLQHEQKRSQFENNWEEIIDNKVNEINNEADQLVNAMGMDDEDECQNYLYEIKNSSGSDEDYNFI